jgi:DNA-binding response OmpR family regulator
MMPVMDGIQLLKEVKGNIDTATLPVILVSARAGEESRIEGYEIGADDYLVKPFSSKELLARVTAQVQLSKKREECGESLAKFICTGSNGHSNPARRRFHL